MSVSGEVCPPEDNSRWNNNYDLRSAKQNGATQQNSETVNDDWHQRNIHFPIDCCSLIDYTI